MIKIFDLYGVPYIEDTEVGSCQYVTGIVPSAPAVCSATLENGRLSVHIVALPGRALPERITVRLE